MKYPRHLYKWGFVFVTLAIFSVTLWGLQLMLHNQWIGIIRQEAPPSELVAQLAGSNITLSNSLNLNLVRSETTTATTTAQTPLNSSGSFLNRLTWGKSGIWANPALYVLILFAYLALVGIFFRLILRS